MFKPVYSAIAFHFQFKIFNILVAITFRLYSTKLFYELELYFIPPTFHRAQKRFSVKNLHANLRVTSCTTENE